MALMLFREQNRVKWIGVRPGHNGTQVYAANSVTHGTTTIHTVTAQKTLHITYWYVDVNSRLTGGAVYLAARVDGGVFIAFLDTETFSAAGHANTACPLTYPIEVPAGCVINIFSSSDNIDISAGFIGWEE